MIQSSASEMEEKSVELAQSQKKGTNYWGGGNEWISKELRGIPNRLPYKKQELQKKRVELYEGIMMDNLPYLEKNVRLEMQKLCEPQAGNITKITIPKYFTVKLLNSQGQEQEYKAIRKKRNEHTTYGNSHRIISCLLLRGKKNRSL